MKVMADRVERRNRQHVFSVMLKEMVTLAVPMVPYLAEDAWKYVNNENKSVFFENF